jgi:hypothetical protein
MESEWQLDRFRLYQLRRGRVVGAKTILYHLHQDRLLPEQGLYLPRSTRTIWQVLKDGGRIPTRVRQHYPIERPAPVPSYPDRATVRVLANSCGFTPSLSVTMTAMPAMQQQVQQRTQQNQPIRQPAQ